jgi:hypothetical protein
MASKFIPMPLEVREKYFDPLIEKHRPDLVDAKFELMFRDGGKWSSKKKETWARTKLLNAETKAMLRSVHANFGKDFDDTEAPNFSITVNLEVWNSFGANDKARFALLHHELQHCVRDEDKDGNAKYSLVSHDLEEFEETVRLYGNWSEDCQGMFDAMTGCGQPVLDFSANEEEVAV